MCRFWDQSTALIYKQLLVYGRNTRATILRLLAPLFFMLLLWLLNIAIRSDNQAISAFEDNPNPKIDVVGPIPTCDDDSFIIQPCWDFVYSPNTSDIANSIAANMRAYNPGRPISEGSVLGFASIADTNAWMLENPEKTLGAVHFLLDANAPTAVPTPGIGGFSVSCIVSRRSKNTSGVNALLVLSVHLFLGVTRTRSATKNVMPKYPLHSRYK
jgi:hypothetical protein